MPVSPRVIMLNGASSSGKSSLQRAIQALLPDPWLSFSVDDLIAAMPTAMLEADGGFAVGLDGEVTVGARFIDLNIAWEHGIAAMAGAGAPVIVDDVLLRGRAGQERWNVALGDLAVLWVGVHCDVAELLRRERSRGDRRIGMAADQAPLVHVGVEYGLEVDTTHQTSEQCAARIVAHLGESTTWLVGSPLRDG